MNRGHKSRHKKLLCTPYSACRWPWAKAAGYFSNYFKEVFAVDSVQRGLLEIPRETPGILCVVILTALSGLGNLSLMVMAYGFTVPLGLAVLSLYHS